MLHGINPGPMLQIEKPQVLVDVASILMLASISMWIAGIFLAKRVTKLLLVPPAIIMPLVAVLCIIGSYSLGLKVFNLWLMVPVGILCYFLGEMGYPVPPLVIGVILGPMADQNIRRALMVSEGSFLPVFTRPVALILFLVVVLTFLSQTPSYKKAYAALKAKLSR